MRRPIICALIFLLAGADAGDARQCDRFRYWRYPTRQACNQRALYMAAHQYHTPFPAQPRAQAAAPSPPTIKDAEGVALLRAAMRRLSWDR